MPLRVTDGSFLHASIWCSVQTTQYYLLREYEFNIHGVKPKQMDGECCYNLDRAYT
jgi:hypothetical protein